MTFKCHEISSVNVGIKSVPLQFDWPSALLPGAVRLVPSQRSGRNDFCWEGTCLTVPGRRALGQWNCKGALFFQCCQKRKKAWKWMLILMILRPQYSYRVREDLWDTPPVTEAHRYFLEKVPENLEISWDFHEISLATMMEFKPALDILAPRASIYLGGLDGDHILPRVGGANPS